MEEINASRKMTSTYQRNINKYHGENEKQRGEISISNNQKMKIVSAKAKKEK